MHRIPSQSFGTISRDAKAEKLNMQQQRQLNGNTIPIRVITDQPTSWIEISKLSLIAVAADVAADVAAACRHQSRRRELPVGRTVDDSVL